MKSALLATILLALPGCDRLKDPAKTRTGQLPEACCKGGGEDSDRSPVVSTGFLKNGRRRSFAVRLEASVDLSETRSKRLRVWLPVPRDSAIQTIRNLAFSHPQAIGTEPKYGNRIAFWEMENPPDRTELWMSLDATRTEILTDLARLHAEGRDDASAFEIFRSADRLTPLNSEVGRASDQACRGKITPVGKARAIFEYVASTVTLDPSATGAGQGSAAYALEHHRGNSMDMHSLFNSLTRFQGIASAFEVGLSGTAPGQLRSWVLFRAPGKTWVPVDCADAREFPERKDYFFGGLPADRLTLSTGRDLILVPEQESGPLNYFGSPYAEADGRPVTATFSWTLKPLD